MSRQKKAEQMGRGQLEGINRLLLFMYDAYALGYLVTLFPLHLRLALPKAHSARDSAARPRDARVELEESQGVKTHQDLEKESFLLGGGK